MSTLTAYSMELINAGKRKKSILHVITETSEKAEIQSLASNTPSLLNPPAKPSLASLFSSPSLPLPSKPLSTITEPSFPYVPKSSVLPDSTTSLSGVSKIVRITGFVSKWTDKLREENKATEKIRKRISGKIEFKPPSSDYYEKLPVKPGLMFLVAIANMCNASVLKVNIPDMLVIFKEITWVRTEMGRVKARKEFELKDFVKALEPAEGPFMAVMRITNDRGYGPRVICLSKSEVTEKFNKLQFPQFGSIQKFVPTAGGKIVTLRLFYRTRGMASKAYSIKLPDDNSRYALSTEFGMARLEVTEMSGNIVTTLSKITEKVIAFLSSHYYIRFETIVLDFIRDTQENIWLISCKGFIYDEGVNQARITRHSSLLRMRGPEKRKMLQEREQQQLDSQHCRLCLLPYSPVDLSKALSYKFLLQYKHHALKNGRTVMDLSHIRAGAVDSISHTLRVCEICYMLVTSEKQLEKVEGRMAEMVGIPVREMDFSRDIEVVQPITLPMVLHQWRVLIHFDGLKVYHDVNIDLNWWLHYEFLGVRYSRKLSEIVTDVQGSNVSILVNRLHYFFAVKEAATIAVCRQLEMRILLTYTEKSTSVLSGTFAPLSFFSFDFSLCSAFLTSHTALLFANEIAKGEVQIKVGLSIDREISPKSLPISIHRHSQVFIPEETYITSQLLPEAWLEVFTAFTCSDRTEILSSRRELDQIYEPVLRIESELEALNRIHPPKTTAKLQRILTNRLSTTLPHPSPQPSHPKLSHSFLPFPPPNSSFISHLDSTDSDPSFAHTMSRSISTYLCHRSSSATTLKLLQTALNVSGNGLNVTQPDQLSTEIMSQSAVMVDIGNESVEMLVRPVIREKSKEDRKKCKEKPWKRVYGWREAYV